MNWEFINVFTNNLAGGQHHNSNSLTHNFSTFTEIVAKNSKRKCEFDNIMFEIPGYEDDCLCDCKKLKSNRSINVATIVKTLIDLLRIKNEKSNLFQMLMLHYTNKLNDLEQFITMLLKNSIFTDNSLEVIALEVANIDSCAVIFLVVMFLSVFSFFEQQKNNKVINLINQIKSEKYLFITKLFLFIDSFRLFFSSYFSIPKSLIDRVFKDIKPYANVETNGITALDLTFICERFIAKNQLENVVLFMGAFYKDSNFTNWFQEIANSPVKFQFGLYATGVSNCPKHWTSFLLNKDTKTAYLYDSCNQYTYSAEFLDFIQGDLGFTIKRTFKMHQYESNYCGLYCLMFLAVMVNNSDPDECFDSMFIKNPVCMDPYMNKFEKYFYTPYKDKELVGPNTQIILFANSLLSLN